MSIKATVATAFCMLGLTAADAAAQVASATKSPTVAPTLRARPTAPAAAAWALPDPDQLIERVFTRIVNQDKPNAIPVRDYTERHLGREETLAAIRKYAGHPVELRPAAFSAVDGWNVAKRADYRPCIGVDCVTPVNSLWLAVTKIERGELPHELHVWYTTSFASEGPTGPSTHTYSFCERWLRVGGTWKYDGFVRVNSG